MKEGDHVALKSSEGGIWIPREGDDSFPEGEWFPRALRDAVEEGFSTERLESRAHVVFFPFGNTTGEDDEVGLFQSFGNAGGRCLEVIGQVFPRDFGGSPILDRAQQGDAV